MSWFELVACSQIPHRSAYLKSLSLIWGVEVKTIVEIGVYNGANAQLLRQFFPNAHLYLVDPWVLTQEYTNKGSPPSTESEDYARAYEHVMQIFGGDKQVTVLRMESLEAASHVPDGIDLVFIDGNHDYLDVKRDIQTWMPKVRKGGILSGHDYHPYFSGLRRAVDELLEDNKVVGTDDVWAHLKNSP